MQQTFVDAATWARLGRQQPGCACCWPSQCSRQRRRRVAAHLPALQRQTQTFRPKHTATCASRHTRRSMSVVLTAPSTRSLDMKWRCVYNKTCMHAQHASNRSRHSCSPACCVSLCHAAQLFKVVADTLANRGSLQRREWAPGNWSFTCFVDNTTGYFDMIRALNNGTCDVGMGGITQDAVAGLSECGSRHPCADVLVSQPLDQQPC